MRRPTSPPSPEGHSLTVDWDAPAPNSGSYDLDGFEVYISQLGGENLGGNACSAEADPTACTFTVIDGFEYDGDRGVDRRAGYPGGGTSVRSVTVTAVSAPTAVPTKDDGDLKGAGGAALGTLTAGQKVTLTGEGFAPGTTVQLTVFSSPVSLGTVVAGEDGSFSVEVTIPANLADGTHHLVATGIAADGTTRNLVITVTVSGGVATLATTGFDAVPVAVGGGLVLLVGAGLAVGARRRESLTAPPDDEPRPPPRGAGPSPFPGVVPVGAGIRSDGQEGSPSGRWRRS